MSPTSWLQGFRRGAVNGLPPTEAAVGYVTNPGLFKVAPALSATIPTVAAYTMARARVGYALPHWQATLYVDNLTNQLGVNSYTDPIQWGKYYQALVSRPRTIGLTVSYSVGER